MQLLIFPSILSAFRRQTGGGASIRPGIVGVKSGCGNGVFDVFQGNNHGIKFD